jgi:hypothetical protein
LPLLPNSFDACCFYQAGKAVLSLLLRETESLALLNLEFGNGKQDAR